VKVIVNMKKVVGVSLDLCESREEELERIYKLIPVYMEARKKAILPEELGTNQIKRTVEAFYQLKQSLDNNDDKDQVLNPPLNLRECVSYTERYINLLEILYENIMNGSNFEM